MSNPLLNTKSSDAQLAGRGSLKLALGIIIHLVPESRRFSTLTRHLCTSLRRPITTNFPPVLLMDSLWGAMLNSIQNQCDKAFSTALA